MGFPEFKRGLDTLGGMSLYKKSDVDDLRDAYSEIDSVNEIDRIKRATVEKNANENVDKIL
jgi:hypothetical protein